MKRDLFSQADIEQIEAHGLTAEQVCRQMEMVAEGPRYLKLLRPCTLGDGIKRLDQESSGEYKKLHEAEAHKGRFLKFVPASGAASRMFKSLHRYTDKEGLTQWPDISAEADQGNADAREVVRFIKELERFAFFEEVREAVRKMGIPLEGYGHEKSAAAILRTVLFEEGLGYGLLPKGLLKFHRYGNRARTAFEEHLVEAAAYVVDGAGKCAIHFTVSPEHLKPFESLFREIGPSYEHRHQVKYDVSFSTQQPSTDTVAVGDENRPFRDEKGSLLFRPGGHGALLQNLNDLKADLVFMKNIDNVAPDHLKPATVHWKKVMAGHLIHLQNRIFQYLQRLSTTPIENELLKEIREFVEGELCIFLSQDFLGTASHETLRARFHDTLNRPVRVCGMVKNQGEPGGGPFWVQAGDGSTTLQIVESAQVNPASREQAEIWASATHFNPVDIVCGLRDWRGNSFDLPRYVDPQTFLVSRKSSGGKTLKALELPGLWNGAMSRWITVFVEVPIETFSPVKTVTDLLRKEHQPPEKGQ